MRREKSSKAKQCRRSWCKLGGAVLQCVMSAVCLPGAYWLPVSSIFTLTLLPLKQTAMGRSVFQAFYLPSRVMCLCLGGLCFPCDLVSWLCLSLNIRMSESQFVVWWPQCHCSVEKSQFLFEGFGSAPRGALPDFLNQGEIPG